MKLYLTPEDGYFHQCLDPLFRSVYRIQEDGYYKCPVCSFKFPSILTLASENRKVLRYDRRMLLNDGYEQLGRIPSVDKSEIAKNIKLITIIDV